MITPPSVVYTESAAVTYAKMHIYAIDSTSAFAKTFLMYILCLEEKRLVYIYISASTRV